MKIRSINIALMTGTLVLLAPSNGWAQMNETQIRSETEAPTTTTETTSYSPRVAFKIGPSLSTIAINTQSTSTVKTNEKTGLNMAIDADIPLSESFSLSTGLNYIQKGTYQPTTNGEGTLTLNYLEIPLLAKKTINLNAKNRLSFAAGPYIAFALSKSGSEMVNGTTTDLSSSVSKAFSSIDMGARIGANYEYAFSQTMFFVVSMNYDLGLKDISTQASAVDYHTGSLNSNLGLGVIF